MTRQTDRHVHTQTANLISHHCRVKGRGGKSWLNPDGCRVEGRSGNSWLSPDGCRVEGRSGNSWLSPDGCRVKGRSGNSWLSPDGCRVKGRSGNSWLSPDGCRVEGRSGNSWLSPDGCAMFSVHVRISTSSFLGQRVSFIQHLMSLAVVLAVRQKPQCDVRCFCHFTTTVNCCVFCSAVTCCVSIVYTRMSCRRICWLSLMLVEYDI